MAAARHLLEQHQPSEAVRQLEAVLPLADGNSAYLELLRQAYQAELTQWEQAGSRDERIDQLRRYIELLQPCASGGASVSPLGAGGGAASLPAAAKVVPPERQTAETESTPAKDTPPAPATTFVPPPSQTTPAQQQDESRLLNEAVLLFQQKRYAEAARRFAQVPQLSAEHKAAWAYCRVCQAVERLQQSEVTVETYATVAAELQAAAALLPTDSELRRYAERLATAAQQKAQQGRPRPAGQGIPTADTPVLQIETASFRIQGSGPREYLEQLGRAAEQYRHELFNRWSGPPAADWQPKCDVVLHASDASFSQATGLPVSYGGVAQVTLQAGRVTARRVDLRSDTTEQLHQLLRRELMHVVLADLFPQQAPPRWAIEGMAVRVTGTAEVDRYRRTLLRLLHNGETLPLATLLAYRDCPPERVTPFCCQSVCLTDFLIQTGGGERNFTLFLRDAQRYGLTSALKRQYGFDTPTALEAAWKRWLLTGNHTPSDPVATPGTIGGR